MSGELEPQLLREVVEQARGHDPDAWERLFRHSHRRLLSYANRRLSTLQAAEDAVSDTIVRAMDRIDGFTWQGAGFDAWMYGILRNVVLEAYRQQGRVHAVEPDVVDDRANASMPEVDHRLLQAEELTALRRAFADLEPAEQEVLELRFVGGLGADDVGSVIGKSAGAVRMAQSRALARLRSAMKVHDDV